MLKLGFSKLPDGAGVWAAIAVLESAFQDETDPIDLNSAAWSGMEISLGRVCGGRVSGVWLGDDLELVSFTLEPFELDDAVVGRARALEFVARVHEVVSR